MIDLFSLGSNHRISLSQVSGELLRRKVLGLGLRGLVLLYKLRYIVGFGLVEMAISTNPKPTIYRDLYENTGYQVYSIFSGFNFDQNVIMQP